MENPYQPNHGGGNWDAFVTKLSSSGDALIYSTFLGGSAVDAAHGIAVNSNGFQNTVIKNCIIEDYAVGINSSNSQNIKVFNNTINSTSLGINVHMSNGANISTNKLKPIFFGVGIGVSNSTNAELWNNHINPFFCRFR